VPAAAVVDVTVVSICAPKPRGTHFSLFYNAVIFTMSRYVLAEFRFHQPIRAWIIIMNLDGLRMNHAVELNNITLVFRVNDIDVGNAPGSNLNLRWQLSSGNWGGGHISFRKHVVYLQTRVTAKLLFIWLMWTVTALPSGGTVLFP
jgi:hypothetical protein